MAKKDEELIKYITQRVVQYIDTPREERKKVKQEQQHISREPWMVRWFGFMPFSLNMWANKHKKRVDQWRKKKRS